MNTKEIKEDQEPLPFREALRVWIKIGLLSFGGPAGQIALMHRMLVEERKWISNDRFLHALNYCHLLPGPEAQQLATYIGWLLHGTRGGLAAGLLFIIPGMVTVLILTLIYAGFQHVAAVQALFYGLKPAVLAIVVIAVFRIGAKALKTGYLMLLAGLAFIAMFFYHAPFPVVIVVSGLLGYMGMTFCPQRLGERCPRWICGDIAAVQGIDEGGIIDLLLAKDERGRFTPTLVRSLKVLVTWGSIWLAPVLLIVILFGPEHVYSQISLFFSKMAMVTFGGAYAVLSYMAQEAVSGYGWLHPGEMLDGLALAETTPGPLIQVVQFVGFLAAYRDPGILNPYIAGILGTILTVWVTFAPCFLWIFLGAPYVEQLRHNRLLNGALSGITAAVVGVVLNLSIWFGLSTLFGKTTLSQFWGAAIPVPDLASADWFGLLLALLSFIVMRYAKFGMITVLTGCAGLGFFWKLLF
ncbi:chromate efflux transporter [Desulfopila aestuarii]|uniref:Chromate transporter n=1 Tax=Desulfopila aestuarii DSM 18488 TaxID=1121416 RepID=A0A1M7YK90_9BACT|nr:chromate efflux transporter [Desulfopila aestuarii]SHO53051.1 chromate transporter [Desulfopila aestuarii DSM 18488]